MSESYHADQPPAIPQKQCANPDCKQWYPATSEFFYPNKKMKDGLLNQCKACVCTRQKSYYHRPEVHDRALTWQKAYGETHNCLPEVQERQSVYHQGYTKDYFNRPGTRERYQTHWRNRHARKKAAQGTHTAQDIQKQYERQKGKCYWCSKKLVKYHVDHVIPLSRGGSNGPDNLVAACPTCNQRRGNKFPWEWYEGGKLL